ncbi:Crp/Fnr family transcriptional regulator [Paraliobacillus ryukyuensis]|uniref:Crp/Fnr family transcriptional regulator n=1 Tax=Paraliobacillus ryukyuensis TaxID=200904 RepID=UPI0009A83EAE|nr:Crp/Fnr family transcriptional regulator [Paraliobacillus ryukyuensis]
MAVEETHCHDHGSHKTCVAAVPIFNHLEDKQLDEIMHTVQPISYQKGEHIYYAGDKSDSLYIINSGKVRIYRLSESGKEQLVRILNPGDFTGELALFKEKTHDSYAEAVQNTGICVINRADLQSFLITYPTISLKILNELSNRLDQSEKQTTRFTTEKVERRIAFFLADCLDENDSSGEFYLPMTKKDLASYLGTTPETVSRKLTDLEEQGLIKQKPHKRIQILDVDGLLLV